MGLMSSDDDAVLKIDPALRVAREIANQEGLPKAQVEAMYESAVLGETHPAEMLVQIKNQVTSEAAKTQMQGVIDSLPQLSGKKVEQTAST